MGNYYSKGGCGNCYSCGGCGSTGPTKMYRGLSLQESYKRE